MLKPNAFSLTHTEAHRPHDEPVVLEIGEELGALVVYTDPSLLHREIEISASGDDAARSHKDVLERIVGGRSLYAAVFDKLPGGSYTLWHEDVARTLAVVHEIDGSPAMSFKAPESHP